MQKFAMPSSRTKPTIVLPDFGRSLSAEKKKKYLWGFCPHAHSQFTLSPPVFARNEATSAHAN